MALDLKKLKKHTISNSMRSKSVLLYGTPKCGKSTWASKIPKVLFFNFENGTEFLPLENDPVPISKWTDFKNYLKQLRDPEVQEMFDTIVIDTVTIASQLCEKFICTQNNVDNIKQIPYGAGYNMPSAEFFSVMHEISMMGYGVIYLAHTKTQYSEFFDEKGEKIQQIAPDVDKRIFSILNGMCDIIAYAEKKYDPLTNTMSRVLHVDGDSPYMVSGGRCCQYFPKEIPLDYKVFEAELTKAVERIASESNTVAEERINKVVERDFGEVMNEAKELWVGYISAASSEEEKEHHLVILQDIVQKVFGNVVKLSSIPPSQLDLLELVVDEMKSL